MGIFLDFRYIIHQYGEYFLSQNNVLFRLGKKVMNHSGFFLNCLIWSLNNIIIIYHILRRMRMHTIYFITLYNIIDNHKIET